MYILVVAFTLMSGLLLARRIAEPACPSCHHKNWDDSPAGLQCTRCGWSNVVVVPIDARPPAQYELSFQAEAA